MAYAKNGDNVIRQVKDTAVESASDAAARVSEAVDSMSREAGHIRDAVSRSAQDIANEVTKKLRAAGVDTDQLIITAREQAGDVQKKLMDEVRERPLRALGVAALVGIAFGLLTSRS